MLTSNFVIFRNGVSVCFPVKLRAGISNSDARQLNVSFCHGDKRVVKTGDFGGNSGGWRQSGFLRWGSLTNCGVSSDPKFIPKVQKKMINLYQNI